MAWKAASGRANKADLIGAMALNVVIALMQVGLDASKWAKSSAEL